ncbi:hypothetical protein TcWFU_006541 [Taenia crassiceps]|uniref:Uncharacterized protein n=1 Tax=Taenia crassiceps TaxID=6207 RepID=A0ABR4QB59_9CEST
MPRWFKLKEKKERKKEDSAPKSNTAPDGIMTLELRPEDYEAKPTSRSSKVELGLDKHRLAPFQPFLPEGVLFHSSHQTE